MAPHALARNGYFAGDDEARAADLNEALRDRRIDGVWCLRGGYGAMRLLDRVDWSALRRHAKPILGYSDVTALHGAILILEDVNEAVYRIDRMLAQLRLSGALHGVRAIVFGDCTNCPEEADDGARKLDDVLLELADWLRVPCLAGVPLGHVAEQWTVALGALGELDAGARSLVLTPR